MGVQEFILPADTGGNVADMMNLYLRTIDDRAPRLILNPISAKDIAQHPLVSFVSNCEQFMLNRSLF
jgi:hypothetical protein